MEALSCSCHCQAGRLHLHLLCWVVLVCFCCTSWPAEGFIRHSWHYRHFDGWKPTPTPTPLNLYKAAKQPHPTLHRPSLGMAKGQGRGREGAEWGDPDPQPSDDTPSGTSTSGTSARSDESESLQVEHSRPVGGDGTSFSFLRHIKRGGRDMTEEQRAALFQQCSAAATNSRDFEGLSACLHAITPILRGEEEYLLARSIYDAALSSLATLDESKKSVRPETFVHFLYAVIKLAKNKHHKHGYILDRKGQALILSCTTVFLSDPNTRFSNIAHIIWSLGKLSIKYRYSSPAFKAALQSFLETPCDSAYEIAKLMYGLSSLQVPWTALSLEAQRSLCRHLSRHSSHMPEIEVTNSIYALAKMGARWTQLISMSRGLRGLLGDVARVVPDMSGFALSNMLWGMGKLGMRWEKCPKELRAALLQQIHRTNPAATKTKRRKTNSTPSSSSSPSPQTLSTTLLGLTYLGAEWGQLTAEVQQVLMSMIDDIDSEHPQLNPQAVSNIIYSLGALGADRQHLQQSTRRRLFSYLLKHSGGMTSQGAASSLYGLAKMRFVYSELPPPVTRCIEELVLSVGSTSAPNHDNSPGTGRGKNKNQATFVPSSETRPDTDTADGQTVSSLLWSLGRMHGQWAGVTADTGSSAIHKSTVKTKEEEQEQQEEEEEEESSLIEEAGSGREAGQAHGQGPVLQKVLSAELCAKLMLMLELSVAGMTDQGLSNALLGLAKLRVKWVMLTPAVRLALLLRLLRLTARTKCTHSESHQALVNSLWALSVVGAPWAVHSRIQGPQTGSAVRSRPQGSVSSRSSRSRSSGGGGGAQSVSHRKGDADVVYAADISEEREVEALALLCDSVCASIAACAPYMGTRSLATIYYALARSTGSSGGQRSDTYGERRQRGDTWGTMLGVLESSLGSASLRSRLKSTQPVEAANIIYGLGRMGANIYALPDATVTSLLDMVYYTCARMSEQELGNTVWGLTGQMDLAYNHLPSELRHALFSALVRRRGTLRQQALVAVLWGLSTSESVSWAELSDPPELRSALLETILRLVPSESQGGAGSGSDSGSGSGSSCSSIASVRLVGNILLSLGKLKMDWHADLPADLKDRLLSHLHIRARNRNSDAETLQMMQPFCAALSGIARMAGRWTHLEQRTRSQMIECLSVLGPGLTAREVAGVLWALGRLGITATAFGTPPLSPTPTPSVEPVQAEGQQQEEENEREGQKRETGGEGGGSQYGGFHEQQVQAGGQEQEQELQACIASIVGVFESLVTDMSSGELVWSLWALARLQVSLQSEEGRARYPGLSMQIAQATSIHVEQMSPHELGLLLWALGKLRVSVNDYPQNVRDALFRSIEALIERRLRNSSSSSSSSSSGSGSGSTSRSSKVERESGSGSEADPLPVSTYQSMRPQGAGEKAEGLGLGLGLDLVEMAENLKKDTKRSAETNQYSSEGRQEGQEGQASYTPANEEEGQELVLGVGNLDGSEKERRPSFDGSHGSGGPEAEADEYVAKSSRSTDESSSSSSSSSRSSSNSSDNSSDNSSGSSSSSSSSVELPRQGVGSLTLMQMREEVVDVVRTLSQDLLAVGIEWKEVPSATRVKLVAKVITTRRSISTPQVSVAEDN